MFADVHETRNTHVMNCFVYLLLPNCDASSDDDKDVVKEDEDEEEDCGSNLLSDSRSAFNFCHCGYRDNSSGLFTLRILKRVFMQNVKSMKLKASLKMYSLCHDLVQLPDFVLQCRQSHVRGIVHLKYKGFIVL